MGYLLDTNVLINYVAERYNHQQLLQLDTIVDAAFNVSVISKIETLGHNGDPTEMIKMVAFVQVANILPLSDDVVLQTIALRKALRIKTPDAIIAATALVNQLTLLTHDAGFNKVPGLIVIDPNML